MEIYKMFRGTMGTLLTAGIILSGIPCNPMGGNANAVITVQAAETSPDDLFVVSPLTVEQQREITFNACFYANRYPDLKAIYGYDAAALYQHFLNWGIQEGRCGTPVFDVAYYLETQTDLKAAFGNDYVAAYRHWLQNGYLEERVSSEYYNGAYYRQNNYDLVWMDSYELMHHYLNFAAEEEREANASGILLDESLMKAYYPAYTGAAGSIVTALNELGIDSSDTNRVKIASANEIGEYTGSAEQNIYLLELLREGRLVDPKAMEDSVRFEKGISLDVEDMKQFDKRWKNVKLGKSKETIGKIGCTITCMAMMESYRRGIRITPQDMAKESSFTRTGGLIWPKSYGQEYKESDYLSKILELLSEGKPVMVCTKNNKTNKQHWVVVKGYNGEGVLAENFMINDPGSSYRKTLKEFLDYYYTQFGCKFRCLRYYK